MRENGSETPVLRSESCKIWPFLNAFFCLNWDLTDYWIYYDLVEGGYCPCLGEFGHVNLLTKKFLLFSALVIFTVV